MTSQVMALPPGSNGLSTSILGNNALFLSGPDSYLNNQWEAVDQVNVGQEEAKITKTTLQISPKAHATEDHSSDQDSDPEDRAYLSEIQGADAMDLFIDSLNPFSKNVHSSLQTKIKSKNDLMKTKKKKFRLLKRRSNVLKEQRILEEENKQLMRRFHHIKARHDSVSKNLQDWIKEWEKKLEDERKMTEELEANCDALRKELNSLQHKRIDSIDFKTDPIIIRDGPCQRTTYKMHAKYLQYEIHPLAQRKRLTIMRADHEEWKRKQVQEEVAQLRERIGHLSTAIFSITKGRRRSAAGIDNNIVHEENWRKLCEDIKRLKISRKGSSAGLAMG